MNYNNTSLVLIQRRWNTPTGRAQPSVTVIYTMLGLFILILNISSMLALGKCTRMCKQIQVFAFNLAMSDCIMGCTIAIDGIIYFADIEETIHVCVFKFGTIRTAVVVSSMTMTALAVDRLVALQYALKYMALVTRKKTVACCVVLWFVSVVISVTSYSDGFVNYRYCLHDMVVGRIGLIITCTVSWLCFTFIIMSFLGVATIIRKHIQENNRYRVQTSTLMKRNFGTTLKVSAISMTFLILSTPGAVYSIYVAMSPQNSSKHPLLYSLSGMLIVLNSAINPFLYVLRFQECRLRMQQLIFSCKSSKRDEISMTLKLLIATFLDDKTTSQQFRLSTPD